MKKRILSLLLILCVITSLITVTPLAASAATSGTCGNNLKWTLSDDGVLTISGTGAMSDYTLSNYAPWGREKASTISKIVIENGVTTIGDWAFYDCHNVENIVIPNSVISIGDTAFDNCQKLTKLFIPKGVTSIKSNCFSYCGISSFEVDAENTTFCSIDGNLFSKDKRTLIKYAIGKKVDIYRIPNHVTTIGEYAFESNDSLESIIIPDSVTEIGSWAFFCCRSIISVTIPGSVTSIGSSAFRECINLTSVTIPNSVTSIGSRAFEWCSSLTSVTVPDSVTSIGDWFTYCSSLTSVTVPDSVTSIGQYAFLCCSSLKSVSIPDSVTSIGYGAFQGCSSLISVAIPNSVTNVGDWAFSECSNLKSVTISHSLTSIGYCLFYHCDSLKSVTIPDSVTSIGRSAFIFCDNLTSVKIPDSVTSIGDSAFKYCDNLTDVYYTGSKEEWNKISIGNDNTDLTNAKIHYNSSDIVIHEKHDITIEVRDASTNKLIPDSQISVFSSANNAKFHTLSNGKITLKDVSFPIYQIGVNAWGYDYHKSYKNIAYPENGKIIFAMTSKESQNVPAQGVTIFNKIDKLNVGETHQLEAWVSPLNTTDKNITWSSSDTSVATIDNTGMITAKWNGTTKITAKTKNGNFTDSIRITVSNGTILTSFNEIAYSFENQSKKIPLKIYQNVYGNFGGIIEYNRDKSKGTGGVCAGMVNTSLMFLNDYRDYADYGGNNIRQLSFSNERVKNFIWFMYLSQNKTPFSIAKLINGAYNNPSYPEYDNIQSINRLIDYAQKEPLYISVGSESGGHALLSFGVTLHAQYKNSNCSLLWIYDCNFPDDDNNFIAIYKNADGSYNGEWEYVGYEYPFNSQQSNSRLSFVRYDDIISAAQTGSIQLMSLSEETTSDITFIQNSSKLVLMDSDDKKLSVENGIIYESNIENYTYFDDYYINNNANRIVVPNGQYEVQGSNVEDSVETTIYTSSDSISTITANNAEITFDIRDISTETLESDNFVNINNKSISADYSITYMPFVSIYGYNYDTITISGNTDGIVNTYEEKGNIYVSGIDRFDASVVAGNETITTVAENLNRDSIYCVKVETSDGTATIQVICEDAEITERVMIPERKKLSQPLYDVESGEYSEKQTLTLTPDNEMVCLYYTTDGSEPYEDTSLLYTEPISINQSMTINVLATQYGCENSDILTLDYTLPDITIPVSTLSEGEYTGIQQVELIADDGANIYYTIDGSNPIENGKLYTCPIILTEDTTLKAYTESSGCLSDVCEYTYTINAAEECAIDDIMIAEELVKVNIATNENTNGVLIVACYKDNGALVDVNYCNIELTANILNSKLIDLNTTGATKVSAFLWENMNNLKPLCNKLSKNIE